MLKKLLPVLGLIAVAVFTPSAAHAGLPGGQITLTPATQTAVAGQPVTFNVSLSCSNTWTSGKLQLVEGQFAGSGDNLGSPTSLPAQDQTGPTTFTVQHTFSTSGTYSVSAKTIDTYDGSNISFQCNNAGSIAPVTVIVSAAPTTTTPPTTTVAPTTTTPPTTTTSTTIAALTTTVSTTMSRVAPLTKTAEPLPETGTDNTLLLLALGLGAGSGIVLLARKRLAR